MDRKGIHYQPKLLISPGEFQRYEHEYKAFRKWAHGLQGKRRVSFLGVVHRIFPYLDLALVGEILFHTLKGYLLVYKECLIENTFYSDNVYVVVDKEWPSQLRLHDEDTVSGNGRFQMDERGLISICPTFGLKKVTPGPGHRPWQPHPASPVKPRAVEYMYQDKCMSCGQSLFATMWRQSKRIHVNQYCCLTHGCMVNKDWE